MDWYKGYLGTHDKPSEVDKISSHKWVYVRKNFEYFEETETEGEHWEFDELKIAKDDWQLFEKILEHDNDLDDVYSALTELAELITEVTDG